jgi:pantetheine-phosphate adenylyltransferase
VSEGRAIIPGTFDPVTSGHLDIIERTLSLYDDVIVAVALSPEKGGGTTFTLEERVGLLGRATQDLSGVEIRPFDTLLVDFARDAGARVIVKGLRAVSDFEREFQMAQLNHGLEDEIETMFIMAIPDYAYLSSSAVKEIARHGGPVDGLVPEAVQAAVVERLHPGR